VLLLLLLLLPQGELSPWWDVIHLGLLIVAAGAGLASMLVVVVVFGNSNGGSLNSAHSVLGMIAIGEACLTVNCVLDRLACVHK